MRISFLTLVVVAKALREAILPLSHTHMKDFFISHPSASPPFTASPSHRFQSSRFPQTGQGYVETACPSWTIRLCMGNNTMTVWTRISSQRSLGIPIWDSRVSSVCTLSKPNHPPKRFNWCRELCYCRIINHELKDD